MKASFKKTKVIFTVYLAALVLLLVVFLLYARKTLILYEASQPQYLMDALIAMPDMTLSMNTAPLTFNDFETPEDYQAQLDQLVTQNELEYHFLKESYVDGSLTYGIYAGETPIGTAVLTPAETVTRLIAIPITDWRLTALNAFERHENYNITITVPDDCNVTINDIPLSDAYITDTKAYEELSYCAEYVNVPKQVTYRIEDLKHPARIRITDASGTVLLDSSSEDGTDFTQPELILSLNPTEAEISPELRSVVLDAVETYSNFFSRDLAGCWESVDPIRHLFPEDSIYLSLADQYRREDIQIFSAHTNTHFLNENITEYICYNEQCFSCRVTFDKSMTLNNGREAIDTTDNIYYFVLLNDNWVIADIK